MQVNILQFIENCVFRITNTLGEKEYMGKYFNHAYNLYQLL